MLLGHTYVSVTKDDTPAWDEVELHVREVLKSHLDAEKTIIETGGARGRAFHSMSCASTCSGSMCVGVAEPAAAKESAGADEKEDEDEEPDDDEDVVSKIKVRQKMHGIAFPPASVLCVCVCVCVSEPDRYSCAAVRPVRWCEHTYTHMDASTTCVLVSDASGGDVEFIRFDDANGVRNKM